MLPVRRRQSSRDTTTPAAQSASHRDGQSGPDAT